MASTACTKESGVKAFLLARLRARPGHEKMTVNTNLRTKFNYKWGDIEFLKTLILVEFKLPGNGIDAEQVYSIADLLALYSDAGLISKDGGETAGAKAPVFGL